MKITFLILCALLLFFIHFFVGEYNISFEQVRAFLFGGTLESEMTSVLRDIRFARAATAFLAAGSLATSGLLMQTFFHNPLAGPYILGVQGGASLFVALWTFLFSFVAVVKTPFIAEFGPQMSAFVGSLITLGMLLFASFKGVDKTFLLIIGLIINFLFGGLIQILVSFGSSEALRDYFFWTMGTFQKTFGVDLFYLAIPLLFAFIFALSLSKKLDTLYLGESKALSLGVHVKTLNIFIVSIVSLNIAFVTAACGPISFVGIMAPHLTRSYLKASKHNSLIWGSFFMGGILGLCSELILSASWNPGIPLNALLGLMGAPFLIYLILGKKGI